MTAAVLAAVPGHFTPAHAARQVYLKAATLRQHYLVECLLPPYFPGPSVLLIRGQDRLS